MTIATDSSHSVRFRDRGCGQGMLSKGEGVDFLTRLSALSSDGNHPVPAGQHRPQWARRLRKLLEKGCLGQMDTVFTVNAHA